MKLTKSKLKKLIKEEIQLGKVYTFKDKPPFKTNEEKLTETKWIVYDPNKNDKVIMTVANGKAATKLMDKLIDSGKYKEVAARVVKEGKLTEAPSVIEKDEAGWYINEALEDLEDALKKVKNPEDWAEKYTRSLPKLIETIDGLIKVFGRMK